jgi:GNAT superfamily N-acetyltransferase
MEIIEPATADDIPQLVELLTILFAQEADFTPDPEKQARGLKMILDEPGLGAIFVARADGAIVGMVSLLYAVSTAEGGRVCWLEDMVVRSDRRHAGIGSRLLHYAIDFARAHSFTRITLLTDRGSDRAIRFYSRHGFRPSAMTPLRLYLDPAGALAEG